MTANAYGLRLLRQPRVRLAILVLLLVVVLAFRALQFVVLTGRIQWGYDFSAYWAAANHLLAGEPIYTAAQLAGQYAPQVQYLYLYPPPLAALVTPLAVLFPTDYRAAAWLWSALGAAVLAWSVLAIARAERLADRYPVLADRGRWLLVAGAFAFPPVVGELVLGNVHLLLLGLLTVAWLGIRRRDSRGELVAGLGVGAAAAIKVFPGVLAIWFVLTRRWRAAAAVAIGALALVLLTLPFIGLEPWREFPTVLANLSAPSDTRDTLAPTVWLAPYLGFGTARVLVSAAGLAIIAWAALRARRIGDARAYAIAVTASVLVAPALYQHYLALLVLPFLLALAAGVRLRWLALAYFLMWGGQQDAIGDLAWIVNKALPTLGAMTLLASLIAGSGPTEPSSASSVTDWPP